MPINPFKITLKPKHPEFLERICNLSDAEARTLRDALDLLMTRGTSAQVDSLIQNTLRSLGIPLREIEPLFKMDSEIVEQFCFSILSILSSKAAGNLIVAHIAPLSEKREYARYRSSRVIQLLLSGNTTYDGQLKNVSRGGAYITTRFQLSGISKVKIGLPGIGPFKSKKIKADVIRNEGSAIGVRFKKPISEEHAFVFSFA